MRILTASKWPFLAVSVKGGNLENLDFLQIGFWQWPLPIDDIFYILIICLIVQLSAIADSVWWAIPPGVNLIQEFQSRLTTLLWNEALWLDVSSHVTSFSQSECTISWWCSYSTLKLSMRLATAPSL